MTISGVETLKLVMLGDLEVSGGFCPRSPGTPRTKVPFFLFNLGVSENRGP